jgi:hypothetical protein
VSEQGYSAPEEAPNGNAEPAGGGGFAVGRRVRKGARAKAGATSGRRTNPAAIDEGNILREATKYLIRKVGGHLVASGLREEQHPGGRPWLITVTLRYPTGYETYYGDLLYDGKDFSFLRPPDARRERERAIAEDPARLRQWHESRNPSLRSAEG